MPLNADLTTTIVTNVITAAVAYFGTIQGSKLQIKSQQKTTQQQIENDRQTALLQIQTEQQRLDNAITEQNRFNQRAIKNFISHEIKDNFFKLGSMDLENRLKENSSPFQYSCNYKYSYHEYNQLKYELIKFESDEVEEIINIYNMFYIMERKQDVLAFTDEEYASFKNSFFICVDKYL
ncbi:hypothetical protein NQ129_26405 [Priestia aryabhattai]|uniref:hypothetical protein n=1 Tax=Priestia aryabhattai TaxID=412384 RepID=UPI00211C1EB3|nr:hypothetical protein [Priestia aryabhattai]MCQ9285301.1 hypothetical protein [Priestia aryabhattai]